MTSKVNTGYANEAASHRSQKKTYELIVPVETAQRETHISALETSAPSLLANSLQYDSATTHLKTGVILELTGTETWLVSVWQDLVGAQLHDRNTNLFDVGGHSILMAQILSRVRDQYDIELPVRLLFVRELTIMTLGAIIDRYRAAGNNRELIEDFDATVNSLSDDEVLNWLFKEPGLKDVREID